MLEIMINKAPLLSAVSNDRQQELKLILILSITMLGASSDS